MVRNKKNLAVGELMRKNAYVTIKRKRKYLKISPSAVNEYISRIIMNIETNMPEIAKYAYDNKRTTILVKDKLDDDKELIPIYDDITAFFGRVDSQIAAGEHVYCTKCLKKLEKEER